ncbi:MAG: hypothetical protein CMF25_03570 [Kangiellaceae bacterium]|nr:hypothetical protein [Kangiellaceae bacterium]|tara:strand:- start:2392 stop:3000 length:609 start_codon:yes stop_codon:yes gene_type:complete
MDTKTWLTLGFTFIVGVFSGAYLYVTVFAPQYNDDGFEDPSEIALRIQGQTYGGCQRTGSCPQFELENNRRYTYTKQAQRLDGEDEVMTGKMDRERFAQLADLLMETNFSALAQETQRSCDSYVDGVDYRYNVILEGEQFELDTCGTAFYNSTLERALRPLWGQFATTTSDLPYILERGMTGAAQDALDNLFQYDEKRDARK